MRKRLGIAIRVAALGLCLSAATSWASVGTAPVEILNGTVALTCTNANRILAKGASGGVACSDEIPVGVTQDTLTYRGPTFGSIAANDVVTMYGASLISKATTSFPVGVGCFTGGNDNVSQWDVAYSGLTACAKVSGSGTAIADGARVKQDATDPSKLVTAAASDIGVGIAVAAANDGATTVQVFWGAKQAAVVPVVNVAADATCDNPSLVYTNANMQVNTISIFNPGVAAISGVVLISVLGGTANQTVTLDLYRGASVIASYPVLVPSSDDPFIFPFAFSDATVGTNTYTTKMSITGTAVASTLSVCSLNVVASD